MPPKIPSHGVLNPIQIPQITEKIDFYTDDPIKLFKRITEQVFTPNALANVGPFKAIVLQVEEVPSKPEAGSWVSDFFGSFLGSEDSKPKFVRIKARIPEIHSALPIPENNNDIATIEMYPTFIAQSDLVPSPQVGSLVWVDFVDKVNYQDPMYIRPVDNTNTAPTSVGSVSGATQHNSCSGGLNSNTPKGSDIPGKNKALSHTGLPLLPRKSYSSVLGENKLLKGHKFSPIVVNKWVKAIEKNNIKGISWIGNLPSNGLQDEQHLSGKRETIIYSPVSTDFSAPVELIYYFHGFKEFGDGHDFEKRIIQSSKKMSKEQKRNFVIIIPELPWSINTKTPTGRQTSAWTGKDNFGRFHQEVLNILKESFSSSLNVGYITIVGHSAGGGAIKTASLSFDFVKPNKIVFSDGDFGDYIQSVWDKYVSKDSNVQYDILVQEKGTPFKKAKDFKNKISASVKNVNIEVLNGKSHRDIGDYALQYVGPNKNESTNSNTLSKPEQIADDENPPETTKNQIPKQPDSKSPVTGNAPTSPSAKIKTGTQTKIPQGVSLKKAEPFKESRVYVKDYGIPLSFDSGLLVKIPSVGGQQYLHILVAKRFMAMNAKWQKDTGEQEIKVASGWRQHRWKSREHYEQVLISKYGSIEKGRKLLAYNSPHELGLAFDLGNLGLTPNSKINEQQKQTKLYKWLKENSYLFGIQNYQHEAWHYEMRLPKESWLTGKEFTDNYAVVVANIGQINTTGGIIPTSQISVAQSCVVTMKDVKNA